MSYQNTYKLIYTVLVAPIHDQDLRSKVVLKSWLKASSFTWHSKITTLLSTIIRKRFSLTVQETIAPPNTFIHVESFSNPKHLADYFQYIDKNYDLYNSYFKWKGTGKVVCAQCFIQIHHIKVMSISCNGGTVTGLVMVVFGGTRTMNRVSCTYFLKLDT